MAKIKRLINFVVPVTACNFRCHYCYVGQEGRNTGEMGKLNYSLEHIQKCMTTERWGGVCNINMCGLGETLLPDYMVPLADKMLENGHFVSVVTNGTVTKRLQELCNFPRDYKERLFVKFSFHYLELRKHELLEHFFENVRLVRDSGIAFTIELTVNDESIPHISEIRSWCEKETGAVCHVIESRNMLDGLSRLTKLPESEHKVAWGTFHSDLFDFQQTIWMEKRREFCYAGDWICSLNVDSGNLFPCFGGGHLIQNVFEDSNEPIQFAAIGCNCQWPHCFAAHAMLSVGAIPEMDTPTYASFRDRQCADGTSWLTPSVREFFASKLCESNEEYTENKKHYIDALMAFEYGNKDVQHNLEEVGQGIAGALQKRRIHSIAVWGRSRYTEWLLSVLHDAPAKVKYVVDTDFYTDQQPGFVDKLKRRYKYSLKRLVTHGNEQLLLNQYDRLPEVDAMVITDWAHFHSIKEQIPKIYRELLSITELAD